MSATESRGQIRLARCPSWAKLPQAFDLQRAHFQYTPQICKEVRLVRSALHAETHRSERGVHFASSSHGAIELNATSGPLTRGRQRNWEGKKLDHFPVRPNSVDLRLPFNSAFFQRRPGCPANW